MSSKKIVYIRHGDDAKNGYMFDESLTKKGKKRSQEKAKKLVKKYGIPDIIYYSPFYRTKQTKNEMLKIVGDVPTQFDIRLSRYFSQNQSEICNLKASTLKYNPPIIESKHDFKQRIDELIYDMEHTDNEVVWCITHTIVIDRIIHKKKIKHGYDIPYLDTIIIKL